MKIRTLKDILIIIAFSIISAAASSQVPQGINYQGSLRDNAGFTIAGKQIALRLSIVKDSANGLSEYRERHSVTTSNLGLFDVIIGTGTVLSGNFLLIDWGASKKFLRIEIDTTNGNSFVFMGATQFLSVPYALRSGKATEAEKLSNDLYGSLVPQGASIFLNSQNSPPGYSFTSEVQIPYSCQIENSDSSFVNPPEMVVYGDSILINHSSIYSYYDIKLKKFFALGNPRRIWNRNTLTKVNDKFYYLVPNDTIFEYYPPTNTWTARGYLGNIIPTGYNYTGPIPSAIFGNSIFLSISYQNTSDRKTKLIEYNIPTNQVFDRGIIASCFNSSCAGISSNLFAFKNMMFLFYQYYPETLTIAKFNSSSNSFNHFINTGIQDFNEMISDSSGVYLYRGGMVGYFNGLDLKTSSVSGFSFSIGPLGVYRGSNNSGYLIDARNLNNRIYMGLLGENVPNGGIASSVVYNGVKYFIGQNYKLSKFITPKILFLHQKN